MNIILFEPEEVNKDHITINDRRSIHIVKVLQSTAGDSVRVGVIGGRTGRGIVRSIDKTEVTLEIMLNGPDPHYPKTDLILALPRPIMLKRVLAQAAALGVRRIFLINAKRVEKSFFNASLLSEESYREHLLHGLEQAVDTIMPEVTIHKRFKPFIEDELPASIDYPSRLIAHPDTEQNLWEQTETPTSGNVVIAVGPEGGWIDYEVDKFREQGFAAFSLGPRILRVDTAVPAILAQINLLRTFPKKIRNT